MRWTVPLLFLLAASVAAQTTVPDTLALERFYPLDIGNRWEYGPFPDYRNGTPSTHYRLMIVGDTLIDGARWAVQREQTFSFGGTDYQEFWERLRDERVLVRFDPDLGQVVRRDSGGARPVYPCPFDIPSTPPGEAGLCGAGTRYTKGQNATGTFALDKGLVLRFGTGAALAYGVGPTVHPDSVDAPLELARVGDDVFGEPFFEMPYLSDLTPPASYYPLGVGDQWIYATLDPLAHGYRRRTVVRDTVVDGLTYAVVESTAYDLNADASVWKRTGTQLLRFDPRSTDILEREEGGEESTWICALGVDFLARSADSGCGSRYTSYVSLSNFSGSRPLGVRIGGQTYEVPEIKVESTIADPGPPGFAAGIGRLERNGFGRVVERFEYARVGGVEYGSRPVAAPDRPAPPAFEVSAGPNPTAGPVALRLDLPAPADVAVEAFDVLGRRVWRTTAPLGAGRQTVALDAGAWAPGLYVVRVTAGGAARTVRVVRQ